MSLLSIDITKVKRPSLRGVTLPPPPQAREPIREIPPEDPIYTRLVAINPILEDLVKALDLVNITPRGPKIADSYRLTTIAGEVLLPEVGYSREEAIERIREITKVDQERAERGLNLMVEAGAIEATPAGIYYLAGSTPF
jgi:hypothetical protein